MRSSHTGGSPRKSGATSEFKNRRTFLKGSVATVAGIGLAGCSSNGDGNGSNGSGSNGGGDEAEIHVVTGETNQAAKQWFDRMANQFMQETGIAVTMDYSSLSPTERISTLIQTGNTPELATLDTGQAAQLAFRDQLAGVSELVGTFEDEYGGDVPDNVRLQMDGTDYTVPLWTNPTQVWYWSDVYEEYGLESSAALTWEEYQEIAAEINSDDMYGTVVPSATSSLSSFTFWNFLTSNGGSVASRSDGDVQIALDQGDNKARAVETVEYLNELHEYSPRASDFEWGDILQSFVSRNSAHSIYGPRAKLQVINNTPERKGEVRPHFPVHNGTEQFINNGGGWVLLDGAEYKDEARQFIEFTARQNRIVDFLTSVAPVHNFPTIAEIAEMDEYRNSEFISENFRERDLEIVQESFEKGISWGGETEPYNQYGPSLFTSQELGTLLYNVNISGKDPEQAVSDTAGRLRDVLSNLQE